MNAAITNLLFSVVERLEHGIRSRDCPAIVALEGRRLLILSDYDYLRDERTVQDFEQRAARHARTIQALRWVFAVPQVWVLRSGDVLSRAVSNHPLRDGEQECIAWTSYDADDGIDYGRVPYTRRPNGEPVFDEPQIFTINLRPADRGPGLILLRTFLDNEANP